jgi:hypothetical protein
MGIPRSTVLSQFQGALLGASLGQAWSVYTPQQSPITLHLFQHFLTTLEPGWSRLETPLLEMTQVLSTQGQWNVHRWSEHWERFNPAYSAGSESDLLLATVAIAVFYHETPTRLLESLQGYGEWIVTSDSTPIQDSPVQLRASVIVIGLMIAQLMQPLTQAQTLIPQLLLRIQTVQPDLKPDLTLPLTQWMHALVDLQTHWNQGLGIEPLRERLQLAPGSSLQVAIMGAIFCFLATPFEHSIALVRARQGFPSLPLSSSLAGSLLGLYNGLMSLPINHNLSNSLEDTYQLATHLWASWAGIYNPQRSSQSVDLELGVSAPRRLNLA